MRTNAENILFLDIETVPQYKCLNDVPANIRDLWTKKMSAVIKPDEDAEQTYQRAGIWAEFGKIVCISAGFIHKKHDKYIFRIKSFYGDDEEKLLSEFNENLMKFSEINRHDIRLCAHNGKEFDFPYIARRMLINRVKLPKVLNVGGKKPWEVPFLDTMELWRFGDYKNYTSLNLMAALFNIQSPKDDIDGSMVADVYYSQKDIERIARYCEKDVLTVALLYLRLNETDLDLEVTGNQ
ncbi:MAG: 3'-5' exonuclease [Prevotellaceae bacterium]|jgi:predicted PolB exonuclease-like 3'-5' exonuclease|nr:3'-5' exonuclease [Prevotellaceae bacterium]